jgi:hypothetical protein
MKTGKTTPATIKHLDNDIDFIWHMQRVMKAHLKAVYNAHKNIPALRQKASDDGVPGSSEAFNLPVVELREDCDRLILVAQTIKAFTETLLAHEPEDWK